MQPAWHAYLLLMLSFNCFANTYMFDMDGTSLKITLPANPSTGYTWKLVKYDEKVLHFNGQEYVKSKSDNIGAPGIENFSFTLLPHPIDVHSTKVTLTYGRQWLPEPVKTTNVIVNVRQIPK